MICGIWLIADNGSDAAKIDLCPGLGQWRAETLAKDERIIGLHSYVLADDESITQEEDLQTVIQKQEDNQKDSSWLDSLGFIVYRFEVVEHPKPPPRPRGRPRKHPRPDDLNNQYFNP